MEDELEFKLKLQEIPIVLEGVDGNKRRYTLRALSGSDRDLYLERVASKVKYNAEGKACGFTDMKGLQSFLLSLSVFHENGSVESEKVMGAWPASVQDALFKRAQKLSALTMDEGTKAGNA